MPRGRASALELDLLQVGVRWETSRRVARVDELFMDDDVELARLARPNVNGPAPANFNPSLHTEGFGFVASDGAVMYEDSHEHSLVGSNLAQLVIWQGSHLSLTRLAHMSKKMDQHFSAASRS